MSYEQFTEENRNFLYLSKKLLYQMNRRVKLYFHIMNNPKTDQRTTQTRDGAANSNWPECFIYFIIICCLFDNFNILRTFTNTW